MDRTNIFIFETYYLGIDPGVDTGFAVWNATTERFQELRTVEFWDAIALLDFYQLKAELEDIAITVVLEDPNLNKPVWLRPGQDARRHVKIAQDVGKNKRDAQLLARYCERNKITVKLIQPSEKGMTKMKAPAFKAYTKYEGSTSQHARDAAMMVFGMK